MATGLTAAWQGMQAVTGDRTMPKLKKAFGQYNAYEDPKFYQDLQMFEQNPTPQRADMMLKEYGDTLDAEDQQALLSKITPMEGTPQYYDWKNAETQYNINKDKATQVGLETEGMQKYYMPTKALEHQLLENNVDMSNVDANNYSDKVDYQMSILSDKAQMSGVDAKNYATQKDLSIEAQQIANAIQQKNLELRNATDPLKIQQLQQEVNYLNDTYDARVNQMRAQSQQAQTQAEYGTRTLEDRVALAGEQALSAALGNEITQGQKPALIEQPYLQNEGSRINNQGGRLNNQLTELELQQAQNQLEQQSSQNSIAYWSEQLGSNFGYAGSTKNGELVFEDTRGGRIAINPQTGETRDYTGQNVEGVREEVMVDPFEMLWNDPIARNTLGQDTITEMATSGQYPRQMTLDEARKFIDNLTYDFDVSDILTSGSLAQNYRPEQSLNEYINTGGQPQPQQTSQTEQQNNNGFWSRANEAYQTAVSQPNEIQKIAQNFISFTPGGKERAIEILQNIQDPEQFKQDYGVDRTAILQELRNME